MHKTAVLCLAALLAACAKTPQPIALPKSPEAPRLPVLHGHIIGNGTDFFSPEHGSAWFLGEEPIRYCLEVAPDFGQDLETVQWMVEEGFRRWANYLEKKKLNDARFHPERLRRDTDPTLRMKGRRLPKCDGSEELKFYFGAEDATVKTFLASYERPIAISERLRYDATAGRGAGFIWVAGLKRYRDGLPNWNTYVSYGEGLQALINHELGHVAGCGHVPATVMDEDLLRLIGRQEHKWEHENYRPGVLTNKLESIENWGERWDGGIQELLSCDRCGFGRPLWNITEPDVQRRLTGREFPADALADTFLLEKAHFATELRLSLGVWDHETRQPLAKAAPFTISHIELAASIPRGGPVFRQVFRRPGEKEPAVLVSQAEATIYTGVIENAAGGPLPVLIKRNTPDASFVIEGLDHGRTLRIFTLHTVLEIDGNSEF